MFLFGGAVGGTQQEIARAAHPAVADEGADSARTFTMVSLAVVALLGSVAAAALAPTAFGSDPLILAVAFVVGLAGYLLTSIVTGILYGIGALSIVSALICVDAVLRGGALLVALALGAPIGVLAFAITLPFGASVGIIWMCVRHRVRGAYRLDIATRPLLLNAARTVAGAASVGVMVAGLPLVLDLFLSGADVDTVASLILVITVTRAPLIIPLMALQSFLVVHFRGRDDARRRVYWLLLACALLGGAAMAAGAFWGPFLIEVVSGGRYSSSAGVVAAVVGSAAVIGMMCVTSAALIAGGRHNAYLAGWSVAAASTVVLLVLVPVEPVGRALIAICFPAAIGVIMHLVVIRRIKIGSQLSGDVPSPASSPGDSGR